MPPRTRPSAAEAPAAAELTAPKRFQSFNELSAFIFRVADLLRGPYQPSEYRHVFIPMTVLRRLECVLAPHKDGTRQVYEDHLAAAKNKPNPAEIAERNTLDDRPELPFFNVSPLDLAACRRGNVKDNLLKYLRGFSANVRALFDQFNLRAHVERIAKADPTLGLLDRVVATFVSVDLSPAAVDNHMMGTAFEDLNRRFLEQANEKAGEQYTPRDVVALLVDLCLAVDGDRFLQGRRSPLVYDPACGTGGMLTVADTRLRALNPKARPILYGQEWQPETWAICHADMLVRNENPDHVVLGNTFTDDKHQGMEFDWQLSNPPFGVDWKGYEAAVRAEAERGEEGRFGAGLPGVGDGSLLFVQHMVKKMRPRAKGGGVVAVVLNGSPLFTGKAGSGESEIRRWLLTRDLVDAIVALPEQLFFGTGIPTYVWLLHNAKPRERQGKVQLIDATGLGDKMKRALGGKRYEVGDAARESIVGLYRAFADGPRSRVVPVEALGYHEVTVEYPLRMRFQATPERVAALGTEASLGERKARVLAKGDGAARLAKLREALGALDASVVWADWRDCAKALEAAAKKAGVGLTRDLREAALLALGERDPTAAVVRDDDGAPVPDAELRDTEHVPLTEPIEAYLDREVRPFEAEAWFEKEKVRVGYEIPLTRYFHTYTPPRPPDVVLAELRELGEVLRRQLDGATTDNVVTRGLDSSAEMRDSGVSWMGQVPKHWRVARIVRVARLESGHTPSRQVPDYWKSGECTIPWFTLGDVWQLRDGLQEYLGDTAEKISPAGLANSSARLLPTGTVILSRTASVGFSGIMPRPMATTQDFANWVCGPALLPEYLLYVLRSMRHEFDRMTQGSTHQTIYMPDLKKLAIPLPPLDEQRAIVAHLRERTAAIDAAADAARRAIALLREYRQSLVTAAVTGRVAPEEPRT